MISSNKIKTLYEKKSTYLTQKMSFSCHVATKKSFYDTVWPQLMLPGSHKYHIKPTGNVRVSCCEGEVGEGEGVVLYYY